MHETAEASKPPKTGPKSVLLFIVTTAGNYFAVGSHGFYYGCRKNGIDLAFDPGSKG